MDQERIETVNSEYVNYRHPASRLFHGEGVNFMTPDVMGWGWIAADRIGYELSSGEGFLSKTRMFGVTIRTDEGIRNEIDRRLSKVFHSEIEATNYIVRLRRRAPALLRILG